MEEWPSCRSSATLPTRARTVASSTRDPQRRRDVFVTERLDELMNCWEDHRHVALLNGHPVTFLPPNQTSPDVG
jgi:hypothetical protein